MVMSHPGRTWPGYGLHIDFFTAKLNYSHLEEAFPKIFSYSINKYILIWKSISAYSIIIILVRILFEKLVSEWTYRTERQHNRYLQWFSTKFSNWLLRCDRANPWLPMMSRNRAHPLRPWGRHRKWLALSLWFTNNN